MRLVSTFLGRLDFGFSLGAVLWVSIMAIVSFGSWLMLQQARDETEDYYRTAQTALVSKAQDTLGNGVASAVRDLAFLSEHSELQLALGSTEVDASGAIETTLVNLMQARPELYSQIRWIDKEGQERVRVENRYGETTLVESDALQNKDSRYYTQQSLRLQPKQFYLSPFDLNQENGIIEYPPNPTFRLSTLAQTDKGFPAGFFIVNVKGESLLNQLRSLASAADGLFFWMAGSDGDWIIGPRSDLEWSRLLGASLDGQLDALFPSAWAEVERAGSSQIETSEGGIVTLSKLHADDLITLTDYEVQENLNFEVYLVAHTNEEAFTSLYAPERSRILVMWITALLLISFLVTLLVSSIHKRERSREEAIRIRKEANANLAAVLESGEQGEWEWEPKTDRIKLSKRSCQILQLPSEHEVIEGSEYELMIHSQDRERVLRDLNKAALEGVGFKNLQYRIVSGSGEQRWISESGVATEVAADGSALRIIGSVTDITEQKAMEGTLRRQAAQLEAVLENAATGIVITKGPLVSWANRAFCEIYGLELKDIQGRTLETLYPNKSAYDSFRERVATPLWSGDKVTIEVQSQHRDGSPRWTRLSGRAVAPYIAPLEMITIVEDLTEQESGRRQRNQLLDIVDMDTDCIVSFDLDLNLLYVNPDGRNLLGLSEDTDIAEMTVRDITPEWGVTRFREEILPVLEGQRRWQGECSLLSQSREEIPCAVTLALHQGGFGSTPNVSAIFRDMRPQKIVQDAMLEARRKAEENDAAKSEFIANMSHEIRTPLHGVISLMALLDTSNLNARQKDYVTKANAAAEHLLSLINDVLDFSKIEADMIELERRPISLSSLCREVHSYLDRVASDAGISVEIEVDDACPDRILGDGLRLRQVLLNLLNNGIKFTTKGEVKLKISQLELAEDLPSASTSLIRFEVSDTGIGIAEEQKERLFERFTQADTSSGRCFGGTGLGLSISQHLVSLMGGRIEVQSRLGYGSRFYFVLPLQLEGVTPESSLSEDRVDNQEQEHELAPSTLPSMKTCGEIRVLAVEDNPLNQDVLCDLLAGVNIHVDVAENGREALLQIETSTTPYQLILMDVQMPVMGGIEATQQLRSREDTRSTPIIGLTADIQSKTRRECIQAGMDEVLHKPFSLKNLLPLLHRFLGADINTDTISEEVPVNSETPLAAKREPSPSQEIEVDEAIERLGGQQEYYIRLAERFVRYLEDSLVQLSSNLSGEQDEACLQGSANLLHSLAGSAATVGAEQFANQLRTLELSLLADGADAAQILQTLEQRSNALKAQLEGLLGSMQSEGQEAPLTQVRAANQA